MNWEHVKATLKGAWKSWTVWAAGLFAALPEIVPLVLSEWPSFAPFVPDWMESKALQVASLVMVLLRIKTTRALAEKVQK